jgi:hypothetical protein
MYPHGELERLKTRKRILQARIDVRRWECVVAATELARPVAMVDRGMTMWHRVAPFAKLLAIPAGIMFTRQMAKGRSPRTAAAKSGKVAAILGALPIIIRVARLVGNVHAAHVARTNATPPAPARPRPPAVPAR